MRLSVLLSVALLSLTVTALAQSPPGINYQGVARNIDGKPLVSKDITIRISILKGAENGEVEYSEIHSLKTNAFGLFTLVIGDGAALKGDFRFVSWALGNKWLRVDMDADGGSSFQVVGSQEFMSVPYAFYAQYAGNGGNGTTLTAGPGIQIKDNVVSNTGDADASATNELNTGFALVGTKLKLTDAGGTKEVDIAPVTQSIAAVLTYGTDAGGQQIDNLGNPVNPNQAATKQYVDTKVAGIDASNTNEIQDLALNANKLTITNNPTATPIDLAPYLDNTDNQNLSATSTGTNRTISITNGTSATIDVADNDNNSSNEIQDLSLLGNTLALSGDATTVNLAPYLDNTDSQNLSATAAGTNRTIAITNGTSATIDVADNDNNPNNEIQDLSLAGNTLSLTGDASPVNLAPYLDNTDNQNLSATASGTNRTIAITNGTPVTIDVADNDNSTTNELQNLTYTSATKTLTISSGNNVTIPETQTLSQVLSLGADAGAQKISNLGTPTANSDATTKKYTDDADAVLASKIATNYAFKANFNYTNSSGLVVNDQAMPFTTKPFDDFNVVSGSTFTATEAGTYLFVVDGSYTALAAGGQISMLFNGTKYPVAIVQPWGSLIARFNATMMFRLLPGQTVSLVGDNILTGAIFTGSFSGHKL